MVLTAASPGRFRSNPARGPAQRFLPFDFCLLPFDFLSFAACHAVVIGTAITRPREITARFASGIAEWAGRRFHNCIGLDLGGTNIKFGVVSG